MLPICDSAPFLLGLLCCNSWPQFTRCPFHQLNKQCALETRRRMRKRPTHHNSAIFVLRSFNDYDPKGIRSNICSFLLADFGGNMFGSCAWSWAIPRLRLLLFCYFGHRLQCGRFLCFLPRLLPHVVDHTGRPELR